MNKLLRKIREFAKRRYDDIRLTDNSHCSHAAVEAIEEASQRFDTGYGVEGFATDEGGRHGITYLNMGDAYAVTVIFDSRTERFRLGCWADIAENMSR